MDNFFECVCKSCVLKVTTCINKKQSNHKSFKLIIDNQDKASREDNIGKEDILALILARSFIFSPFLKIKAVAANEREQSPHRKHKISAS